MTTTIEDIARICHEANRALCIAFGDTSQVPWDEAPPALKASAIDGVLHLRDHPDETPQGQHAAWCAFKRRQGWVYGPIKDAAAKTHPCLVPYDQLPAEQQAKDYVFQAVARELLRRYAPPTRDALATSCTASCAAIPDIGTCASCP